MPRAIDATGATRAGHEEARPRFLPPLGAVDDAIPEATTSRAVVIAPAAWRRGDERARDAAGYAAQRAAQARDRHGLHLEDWRGAALAYAAALRTAPAATPAPAPTISLLA